MDKDLLERMSKVAKAQLNEQDSGLLYQPSEDKKVDSNEYLSGMEKYDWYELKEEGIPTMAGRDLEIRSDDDEVVGPTPTGSLIAFDKKGEVIDIFDRIANGVYDRGGSMADLGSNERTTLKTIQDDVEIKPVSFSEVKQLINTLYVTW